jgi:pimeloyl-ACP methyl ester carboxylesterase
MTHLHTIIRGHGFPILLVHGFPLDYTMWTGQIDDLSQNYRVIAPDLRGFGRNEPVTAEAIAMDDFADDLNDLLDSLDVEKPICFCGLSMGGYVGFRFFEKYGDRLSSLILCDTRPGPDSEEAAKNRRQLAEKVLRSGSETAVEAMLPKLVSRKTNADRPDVLEQLRGMIQTTDPRSIAAALHGMAVRPDSTPLLASITIPTLVLCGAEDALTPPAAMREMAEQIPNAEYVEIPDAGHMAPLENPAAVNAAIRWFLAAHFGKNDNESW